MGGAGAFAGEGVGLIVTAHWLAMSSLRHISVQVEVFGRMSDV